MASEFPFAFDLKFQAALLPVAATPLTAKVTIEDDGSLRCRFGVVKLETTVANVKATELSGPYKFYKAIGIRLSGKDRGVTFGSNTDRGVCVKFHEAVPTSPPFGTMTHTAITLTLEDPEAFIDALKAYAG